MILLLLACDTDPSDVSEVFDGPTHAVVLHPEQGGPFYEPVGIVSSERNGGIGLLDLKHGWYLADDPASPFLPSTHLATGSRRILGPVVAYAPDETVTLYVADRWTQTLLQVPWVTGVDGAGHPVEIEPALTEDGVVIDSAADLSLEVELRSGRATTETWVLTSDGREWTVEGSRSGVQRLKLRPLEPWNSDARGLELVLRGSGENGDTITFGVDTGVIEHDLGGVVNELALLADQSWLLVSVTDTSTQTARLLALDPADISIQVEVPLPASSHPWRMASDRSGDLIFVADSVNARVYEILLDREDPSASALRTLATGGPVVDLAWQGSEDFEHLFIAVQGENRIDVLDLATDTWLDLNPGTPELDAMFVEAPVTGLAAPPHDILLKREGDTGERERDYVVAISTFEGALLIMEASTGCLAWDDTGPYAVLDGLSPFIDVGASSNPTLEAGGDTLRAVQVSPCAGLTPSQSWVLTYDGSSNDWVVEGALDGAQERRAVSDQRYVTDDGAVSFTIRSGTQPASDGDRFLFHVFSGVGEVDGDLNNDGVITIGEENIEVPGRPAAYSYLAGPDTGAWQEVNRKVGVLWPITNADEVHRVNLQSGQVEVVWH